MSKIVQKILDKASASGCVVARCDCKHKFQDKQYGKQMRVMNITNDGRRCTACGKEYKK